MSSFVYLPSYELHNEKCILLTKILRKRMYLDISFSIIYDYAVIFILLVSLKWKILLPISNIYQIQKYLYKSFVFVPCIITCFKKKLSIFSASKGRMHFLQSMCLSREVKVQVHIIMLMLKWESRIISWNLVRNKRNFSILNKKSLI